MIWQAAQQSVYWTLGILPYFGAFSGFAFLTPPEKAPRHQAKMASPISPAGNGFFWARGSILVQLRVEKDGRGNTKAAYGQYTTDIEGIFYKYLDFSQLSAKSLLD